MWRARARSHTVLLTLSPHQRQASANTSVLVRNPFCVGLLTPCVRRGQLSDFSPAEWKPLPFASPVFSCLRSCNLPVLTSWLFPSLHPSGCLRANVLLRLFILSQKLLRC